MTVLEVNHKGRGHYDLNSTIVEVNNKSRGDYVLNGTYRRGLSKKDGRQTLLNDNI